MRESADDEVSASDRIYQEFPLLRPYREYFGQLEKSDVLGEGTAGLVVRARKEGMVAKIARTAKARLNLEREMDDHEYIFSVYRRWMLTGKLPQNLRLPSIRHQYEYQGLYLMEELPGVTVKRLALIERFELRESLWEEALGNMSDYEVEEFVLAVSGMHHDELANWLRDGVGLLEHTNPELASCVREGIEFLKSHGIRHDDLHAGNLIVDDYWNVGIIDFDQVTIYRFDS